MNRGTSNHYALLLQDDAENEGIATMGEEEEEEEKEGRSIQLNGQQENDDMMEQEEDDDDDDEDDDYDINEDSDEEEIFSSSKHRSLSNHEGPNLNGRNHMGGFGNEYCLLNNSDCDVQTSTALEVPVTIWTGPAPMSPARRACFIASIMFAVLVVASFVLVLPCNVQPCEGIDDNAQSSWAVQIDGMGCNNTLLVGRLHSGHNILLSYYTATNVSKWEKAEDNSSIKDEPLHKCAGVSECWSAEDESSREMRLGISSNSISDGECGLLLLDGTSGKERWRSPLPECPTYIQCDLIDVSGDGLPDCIIQGSDTMNVMVEPRYGNIIWYLEIQKILNATRQPSLNHNHGGINAGSRQQQPTSESVSSVRQKHKQEFHHSGPPLSLTDTNSDGMDDLLVPGYISMGAADSPSPGHANELILVSGKTGLLLGKPVRLNKCYDQLKLHWMMEKLRFACITKNSSEVNGHIPLHDLLHKILGPETPASLDFIANHPQPGIPQPFRDLQHNSDLGLCEIKVTRKENCSTCASKFQVFRPLHKKIIWEEEFSQSVIVSWKILSSKSNQCLGAIIKLWKLQHINQDKKPTSYSKSTEYVEKSKALTDEKSMKEDILLPQLDISFNNATHANLIGKDDIEEQSDISNGVYDSAHNNMSNNELYINTSDMTSTSSVTLHNNMVVTLGHLEKSMEITRQRSVVDDENNNNNKFSEHPTHHGPHHSKVTTTAHENITEDIPMMSQIKDHSTYDNAFAGEWTLAPNIDPPDGYELQHVQEQILLVKPNKNGTWEKSSIAEVEINQLCRHEHCSPSLNSHANSVQVIEGRDKGTFQILCYTSTFSSIDNNNSSTASSSYEYQDTWNLITIIKNMIIKI